MVAQLSDKLFFFREASECLHRDGISWTEEPRRGRRDMSRNEYAAIHKVEEDA
jgi:hypothetical protein